MREASGYASTVLLSCRDMLCMNFCLSELHCMWSLDFARVCDFDDYDINVIVHLLYARTVGDNSNGL